MALALYVTHTRLALGHWPVPHTDYDLGALHDIHNILFGLLYLFAVYGALPIWLICLFLSRSQPDAREWWVQASVFFGSWGIIVLAAYFDPTTFANKTDAGNGSKAICSVSNVLRSPSPDPKRSAKNNWT